MPNVTGIKVRCSDCDHNWELPFSAPIIGASTGDEITVPPGWIKVECPRCHVVGTNPTETKAQVTGEEVRGLFAVLRSVSLTGDDIRKLSTIATEAKESGSRPEEVAEQIKNSIPRLRPVLTWMSEYESVGTWLLVLIGLATLIVTIEMATPSQSQSQSQSIVIESPSGEEHLLEQIVDELRSALKASSATDGQHFETKPKDKESNSHQEIGDRARQAERPEGG